jgi:hypothetical protein
MPCRLSGERSRETSLPLSLTSSIKSLPENGKQLTSQGTGRSRIEFLGSSTAASLGVLKLGTKQR